MWRDNYNIVVVVGARDVRGGVTKNGLELPEARVCFSLASAPMSWPAVHQALEEVAKAILSALATARGASKHGFRPSLRVLVADRWLAMANIPWSPALGHASTGRGYAIAHLCGGGFSVEPGDTIRINDARWRQPALAVAYPAPLLESLRTFAAQLGARLKSVTSLGISVSAGVVRRLPKSALLAVVEGGEATLWQKRPGGVSLAIPRIELPQGMQDLNLAWRRIRLRDAKFADVECLHLLDLDGAAAQATLSDEMVLLDLKGPAGIPPVLRLALSGTKPTGSDAVQETSRPSPLPLALSLASVVLAMLLLFQTGRLAAALEEKQRQVASMSKAAAVRQSANWSKSEVLRVRAVNGAIRQLNLPVADLLKAMEPAKDIRIALLGVEFAPENEGTAGSLVKLTVEAKDGLDMTRYVAYLAERRPFVSAYLAHHEIVEADAQKPYRFTVEATWRD